MEQKPPITDSPWFWVLVFSLMALGAVAAISGKYGRRQATIERQYQARERVAAGANNNSAGGEGVDRRGYATPGETLIPLWPLAFILAAVAILAGVMLYRDRGRGHPGSLADEGAQE